MTEPDVTPSSEPETTLLPVEPPAASPPPRSGVPAWLFLLGFLVLAAAVAAVWAFPRQQPAPPPASSAALTTLSGRLDGLAAQLAVLGQKLATLPPQPDLGPIEARLAALEKRPPANPSPQSLAPPDQAELSAAVAPLSARIDALGKSLAALSARLSRIERLARIEAAATAFAAGRPLGALPEAPAALARFATTAPPTLASLRLSYPQAARAELTASRPSTAGKPFLERLLAQAGNLITLRSGNRVIIGNPAEETLAAARTALEAGDLSACLAALAALPKPLAPAMAAWKDEATALRDAEVALAALAGST
ncbi:MAG TPA: hypothetical protein VG848_06785 [Acetobacteraceae bacterium]|nr:hypothetical protein [Acetobacteraceae bacterium]